MRTKTETQKCFSLEKCVWFFFDLWTFLYKSRSSTIIKKETRRWNKKIGGSNLVTEYEYKLYYASRAED